VIKLNKILFFMMFPPVMILNDKKIIKLCY